MPRAPGPRTPRGPPPHACASGRTRRRPRRRARRARTGTRETEAWRALAAQGRKAHQEHLHFQRDLGLLALQAAPGYVAWRDAEEVLHILGAQIGSSAEKLLACRRYALTGGSGGRREPRSRAQCPRGHLAAVARSFRSSCQAAKQ
ncbi:hypothetical protein [Kitasatospora aureofaciens]|uniref:hypothetical protein n=1 Tax=Kitasatospora aureofaciens TaxID=1894 RepID=UPI0038086726